LGKTSLLTPVYISVAWTLMTSYQLFTQTTVDTLTTSIYSVLPAVGEWMAARIDLIVFIHSFAWIFLLSSFIPALLLGKQRGVLIQFGVCLTLAILANIVQGAVTDIGLGPLDQILGLAPVFQNPALALAYMSLPYVLMVGFDIRGKRKKDEILNMKMEPNDIPQDIFTVEDGTITEENTQEEELTYTN
jgi:hypothetical protein